MSLILRKRIAMLTPAAPAGFSVIYALTNVTSSNTDNTVANGGSYTTTLTAATDFNISSVTVTMGGIDITATAYSNGAVTIAEVTGEIVITATGVSIWADYITIRTRTYNASTQYNISHSNNLFSEMVIDGQVLPPVSFYDFGDNAYHVVRLKAKDMTIIKASQFQASNYCYSYVRIPAGVTKVEQNGLRYLGSSQAVSVIFEDKVPPTMLGNSIGTTSIRIYVPDESLEAYKAGAYWSAFASKIYPISQYSGTIYY